VIGSDPVLKKPYINKTGFIIIQGEANNMLDTDNRQAGRVQEKQLKVLGDRFKIESIHDGQRREDTESQRRYDIYEKGIKRPFAQISAQDADGKVKRVKRGEQRQEESPRSRREYKIYKKGVKRLFAQISDQDIEGKIKQTKRIKVFIKGGQYERSKRTETLVKRKQGEI
jgi:hypothetical protein